MKTVFKIFQVNFNYTEVSSTSSEHEHDFFLKLDDQPYTSLKEAEQALQKHLDKTQDSGEFVILPIYMRE